MLRPIHAAQDLVDRRGPARTSSISAPVISRQSPVPEPLERPADPPAGPELEEALAARMDGPNTCRGQDRGSNEPEPRHRPTAASGDPSVAITEPVAEPVFIGQRVGNYSASLAGDRLLRQHETLHMAHFGSPDAGSPNGEVPQPSVR